jgi:tetratricopeptide (TPR) repeat protein
MKGLQGFTFVAVVLGLMLYAPKGNAQSNIQQAKTQQENFQVQVRNLSTSSKQDTKNDLKRGLDLLEAEDYRGAIQAFSKVISAEENNQYAYCARGISYFQLEQDQEAKADLDKSISLDTSNPYAYLFRGFTQKRLKNKQEAIADFQVAANLFQKEGQTEMAKKALEELENARKS